MYSLYTYHTIWTKEISMCRMSTSGMPLCLDISRRQEFQGPRNFYLLTIHSQFTYNQLTLGFVGRRKKCGMQNVQNYSHSKYYVMINRLYILSVQCTLYIIVYIIYKCSQCIEHLSIIYTYLQNIFLLIQHNQFHTGIIFIQGINIYITEYNK